MFEPNMQTFAVKLQPRITTLAKYRVEYVKAPDQSAARAQAQQLHPNWKVESCEEALMPSQPVIQWDN